MQWVESNIYIFDMQEYISLLGVSELGMLHIVMIQSTWETLQALYTEEVRPTSDKKVRRLKCGRESDYCIVLKKQGNACRGKAVTQHRPLERNIFLFTEVKNLWKQNLKG